MVAPNFLNVLKDINLYIEETHQTPNSRNRNNLGTSHSNSCCLKIKLNIQKLSEPQID